jgi:hypothetical protein
MYSEEIQKNLDTRTVVNSTACLYFVAVRNTTKLKTLLLKYTVTFDMDDDGLFTLVLIDKATNDMHQFEGESYGKVLAKAYSFFIKTAKAKLI